MAADPAWYRCGAQETRIDVNRFTRWQRCNRPYMKRICLLYPLTLIAGPLAINFLIVPFL